MKTGAFISECWLGKRFLRLFQLMIFGNLGSISVGSVVIQMDVFLAHEVSRFCVGPVSKRVVPLMWF